jgi:hypothetical protein
MFDGCYSCHRGKGIALIRDLAAYREDAGGVFGLPA